MHYFFIDESVPAPCTIVIAAWATEQWRLNRHERRLPKLYRTPVLESIGSMLESLDGRAIVHMAKLDQTLWRPGESDATNDIARMARTDNIWSQSAIFVVAALVKELAQGGQSVGTVDVHFDPKNLRPDHVTALEGTLRKLLASEARRYDSQAGMHKLGKLHFRRIQPTRKPLGGEHPTKFQFGTWVADKLCSSVSEIRATGGTPRIQFEDSSEIIRRTVQQFDGKPFSQD